MQLHVMFVTPVIVCNKCIDVTVCNIVLFVFGVHAAAMVDADPARLRSMV
jgi:hypothetical protein